MRKLKIFITILFVYEFILLTILQIPDYCLAVFNVGFCGVSFRYFFMCIVIPVLLILFVWWLPEISKVFCNKCQCETQKDETITDVVKGIVSNQEIERFISAAIIVGIQKFMSKYPQIKEIFDTVAKTPANKKTN